VSWHRNGRDLALSIESADSPGEVFALDTDHNIVTRWTGHSAVGGVRHAFVEPEAISGAASTTMIITGFLHRPNPREFPGKRPVIISIHGGLESLARPGFPRPRQLLDQRTRYALIYPNMRGSAGSGAAS
jgi:dipeptidyl aminopeptidase/acylaminoacyl peptidase